MRTWTIGSAGDCDVVVTQRTVSAHHCRLTEIADGYVLEDLASSNGTYVNGERIASATRVSASDVISLGITVPMPWPDAAASPGARVVRIGRDADNDIVIDDPRVSGSHPRFIVSGSQTLIEDLRSSNGTFVNSRSNGDASHPVEGDGRCLLRIAHRTGCSAPDPASRPRKGSSLSTVDFGTAVGQGKAFGVRHDCVQRNRPVDNGIVCVNHRSSRSLSP